MPKEAAAGCKWVRNTSELAPQLRGGTRGKNIHKVRRLFCIAQPSEANQRVMYHAYFDHDFYAGRAWPSMPFGINGDFDNARLFRRVFARQNPRWVHPRQTNAPRRAVPTSAHRHDICPAPALA